MNSVTRYAFGPFHVNVAEGVLLRNGTPIALPPKVFATLVALVARAGHLVPRETLVSEVWPDTFVEDSNLTQNISMLRKMLGTDDTGRPYLDTVPKRGYRFAAGVTRVDDPPPIAAAVLPARSADDAAGVTRAARAAVTRLIVLPFRLLRPDPEVEFLAFSLPDAITVALSRLESLIVRSSATASQFATGSMDPGQV